MSDRESEQLEGPWVGYEDAAKHTGLSQTWLRQRVMDGKIPYRKKGRRVLFSVPALDRWINEGDPATFESASVA